MFYLSTSSLVSFYLLEPRQSNKKVKKWPHQRAVRRVRALTWICGLGMLGRRYKPGEWIEFFTMVEAAGIEPAS